MQAVTLTRYELITSPTSDNNTKVIAAGSALALISTGISPSKWRLGDTSLLRVQVLYVLHHIKTNILPIIATVQYSSLGTMRYSKLTTQDHTNT